MKIAIHGTGVMGKMVKELGGDYIVSFVDDIEDIELLKEVDVVIDFSHFSKLEKLIKDCSSRKYPLIIATTGYSGEILKEIIRASDSIPILLSSNMSLGINALNGILKNLTPKLENQFDIEIIEKHHNKKIDSPSGTAITILKNIQSSLSKEYKTINGREGLQKREMNEIGIHSVRCGTIVGEHTIIFAGEDEIIEITHKALSKKIFAVGALKCAEILKNKKFGLYTMEDIF
ncbi:MAG: 4-hydroxy-tetrahydrodipicolinate reductase [Cetobacterium sp.]